MNSIQSAIKRLASSAIIALSLASFTSEAAEDGYRESAAPSPSAVIEPFLKEAERQLQARESAQALETAEYAKVAAATQHDSAGKARAIGLQARALLQLSRVHDALIALEDEARIWAAGGHGPEHVDTLARAAIVFEALGKIADEETSLLLAIEVGQAETKRPIAMANILREVGRRYWKKKKLPIAEAFFMSAAVVVDRSHPESLELAEILSEAGEVAEENGDFDLAVAHFERALRIGRQKAPKSLVVSRYFELLGNLLDAEEDLETAHQLHGQALALRRELAPNSVEVAASVINLATIKQKLGHWSDARDDYYEALDILELLAPGSPEHAACLNNLGALLALLGDLEAAGDLLWEALKLRQSLAPGSLAVASTRDNLGAVAFSAGDYSAAAEHVRLAYTIRAKLAPKSLLLARSLGNMGAVLVRLKRFDEAVAYYEQALSLKQQLAPDSQTVALTLNNLGAVALELNDLNAAARFHGEALKLRERLVPNSIAVADSLTNLSNVAAKRQQWVQAEALASRAWEIVRDQGVSVVGDQARQAFEASAAGHLNALIRAQLALKKTETAFQTLEGARANALRQLLIEGDWPPSATQTPLLSKYRAAAVTRDRAESAISRFSAELSRARDRFGKIRLRGGAQDELRTAQRDVDEWREKLEFAQAAHSRARIDVDQAWRKLAPRFAPTLGDGLKAITLSGSDSIYVAFLVNEDETILFALEEGQVGSTVTAAALDISQADLEERAKRHRTLVMTKETPLEEIAESGRELYQTLFPRDVQRRLEVTPRLVISPDGPLWDLPFASLVVNSRGRPVYLGSQKALSYTFALSLLGRESSDSSQANGGSGVLVVGDPVFSRGAGGGPVATLRSSHWARTGRPPSRLPTTGTEAMEVANLYGGTPFVRESATEEAVRRHIEGARIVHFATHGYLHPIRAMNSGIFLTLPSKPPMSDETAGDGILEAWEVMGQLRLKADLVVLSACETGRGEIVPGEGVVGLARAFQAAGARSVASTQWQVVDTSTGRFMSVFHKALNDKRPKDVALQEAVKELLDSDGTDHPYYWAAFRLLGDRSPISIAASER